MGGGSGRWLFEAGEQVNQASPRLELRSEGMLTGTPAFLGWMKDERDQ